MGVEEYWQCVSSRTRKLVSAKVRREERDERTCCELLSSKMVKDEELFLTGDPVNSMMRASSGAWGKMQALRREMTTPGGE